MEYPTDNFYRRIGKIVQTQGLDGHVILLNEMESSGEILNLKHLFVELHPHSYIPFFPVEIPKEMDNDRILLLLDDISDVDEARTLTGKSVFIEKEIFQQLFPKVSSFNEDLTGFLMKDDHSGKEAPIKSVFLSGGQQLAVVDFEGKEVIIPLTQDFFKSLDEDNEVLTLNLPDGIWDLD